MPNLPAAADLLNAESELQAKAYFQAVNDYLAGLLGVDGTPVAARTSLGTLAHQTVTRAGNSTVTAADRGRVLVLTGAGTLTLPSAASVGSGFAFHVVTNNVKVTLTPTGGDLIDGASTVALDWLQAVLLVSTGSQWRCIGSPGFRPVVAGGDSATDPAFRLAGTQSGLSHAGGGKVAVLVRGEEVARFDDDISLQRPLSGPYVASSHDEDAGHVVVTGPRGVYGWGAQGALPELADAGEPAVSGLFRTVRGDETGAGMTAGLEDAAGPAYTAGVLAHLWAGDVPLQQWFPETDRIDGRFRSWMRRGDGQGWSRWQMIFNQSNVVGEVGWADNQAVGALIEIGDNSAGRYVRWTDGTQICVKGWNDNDPLVNVTEPWGAIWRSPRQTWVMPAEMVDDSWVAFATAGINGESWVATERRDSNNDPPNSVAWRHYSAVSETITRRTAVVAIGRWR